MGGRKIKERGSKLPKDRLWPIRVWEFEMGRSNSTVYILYRSWGKGAPVICIPCSQSQNLISLPHSLSLWVCVFDCVCVSSRPIWKGRYYTVCRRSTARCLGLITLHACALAKWKVAKYILATIVQLAMKVCWLIPPSKWIGKSCRQCSTSEILFLRVIYQSFFCWCISCRQGDKWQRQREMEIKKNSNHSFIRITWSGCSKETCFEPYRCFGLKKNILKKSRTRRRRGRDGTRKYKMLVSLFQLRNKNFSQKAERMPPLLASTTTYF